VSLFVCFCDALPFLSKLPFSRLVNCAPIRFFPCCVLPVFLFFHVYGSALFDIYSTSSFASLPIEAYFFSLCGTLIFVPAAFPKFLPCLALFFFFLLFFPFFFFFSLLFLLFLFPPFSFIFSLFPLFLAFGIFQHSSLTVQPPAKSPPRESSLREGSLSGDSSVFTPVDFFMLY